MNLVRQATYNGLTFDFFEEGRQEVYMTIEQLAIGFGYRSKKGVEKLLERNTYLKEKPYSFITKVPYATGGTQETRLFTRRGIYEIGSISKTKSGRAFRAWCYDYIEKIEKALARAIKCHVRSIPTQKDLHEDIKTASFYKDYEAVRLQKVFINFNKLVNSTASYGRTTKKEELDADELILLERLECFIRSQLHLGKGYQEIKPLLLEHRKALVGNQFI